MRKIAILLTLIGTLLSLARGQGLVLKYSQAGIGYNYVSAISAGDGVPEDFYDFDGNGQRDLILICSGADSCGGMLEVFGFPGMIPLWSSPIHFAQQSAPTYFMDLDGDGQKELVYTTYDYDGPMSVSVWSVAQSRLLLRVDDLGNRSFFFSDFDGDGLRDLTLWKRNPSGSLHIRQEIWGAGTVVSSPPSALTIITDSSNVLLNWLPVDSCSLYSIEWSLSPNGSFAQVGTSAIPSFTHLGAAILPRAYYRVAAITSTYGWQIVGKGLAAKTR